METDPPSIPIKQSIQRAFTSLSSVYGADRHALKRRLGRLLNTKVTPKNQKSIAQRLKNLEADIEASRHRRNNRLRNRPAVVYPKSDLPILKKREAIIGAIKTHRVVIISGDTGSGKTTQIPKFCLEAGRGTDGLIGCTQPRRIAATTVSRRIADELGESLGTTIGYKIRFRDKTSSDGFIKIMTDGILLAELQRDPFLNAYDTLIVDEAHERSLNIDLSLAIIKRLLLRRKQLKLIITSATIDTEKFSKAFNEAPIIEVSGRMYPIEVRYQRADGKENKNDLSPVEAAVEATLRLTRQHRHGDILVFMPSEQDIRDTCRLLENQIDQKTHILPLFARLAAGRQSKVFARMSGQKIIVATNVAETSITIPGIRFVVDTGLARIPRYTPRSRCTLLPVEPISRSSADQRKGRCGRMADGVCVRLYSEADYLSRPMFTLPEILRANLAQVILQMLYLKLGDVAKFSFIDPPRPKNIEDGYQLLKELGAVVFDNSRNKKDRPQYRLTADGKMMARLPLDPRLSRMIIEARRLNCLAEIIIIAAALSVQDPRERPLDLKKEADGVHAVWNDLRSDFITFLNIWHWYQTKLVAGIGVRKLRRICQDHFLSYRRMREWRDIHQQIGTILKEAGIQVGTLPDAGILSDASGEPFSDRYTALHRSILSGFISHIALKREKNIYAGAKGREVMIFPGSGLFNRGGKWLVAAEMVLTSRLFARTVACINSDWLEALAHDRCRYTYTAPYWDKRKGTVMALEQVSLFGLVIVPQRKVVYGRIDSNKACDVFIEDALVKADLQHGFAFIQHNQGLIDSVRDWENRLRRRDLFVGYESLATFYQHRLEGVWNTRLLKSKIKAAGNDRFLRISVDELWRSRPDETTLACFPDSIRLGQIAYLCSYLYQPGAPEDGVTVRIPVGAASNIPLGALDWLVPGLFPEKVRALIKGLPKSLRQRLGSTPVVVAAIIKKMPRCQEPLINVLGAFIHRHYGIHIPAEAWPAASLPDHLKMRIVLTDTMEREIHASRDPSILRRNSAVPWPPRMYSARINRMEQAGITQWSIDDIPTSVIVRGDDNRKMVAYPGLTSDQDSPNSVSLRLYQTYNQALAAHRTGVKHLALCQMKNEVKQLQRTLKIQEKLKPQTTHFGGTAQLEQQLFKKIVDQLFDKNIRTKSEFRACLDEAAGKIRSLGPTLLAEVTPTLIAYDQAQTQLEKWLSQHLANQTLNHFVRRRLEDLERLVPGNFIILYDVARWEFLPYYIKAIAIRAQRGVVDLEKDRRKADKIRFFTDKLDVMLSYLTQSTSSAKRKAIETFFWMLEGYKTTVFAQELRLPQPISAKQLKQKLAEIERLV